MKKTFLLFLVCMLALMFSAISCDAATLRSDEGTAVKAVDTPVADTGTADLTIENAVHFDTVQNLTLPSYGVTYTLARGPSSRARSVYASLRLAPAHGPPITHIDAAHPPLQTAGYRTTDIVLLC